MPRFNTLQNMFRRYRRPADLVFATLFLALSLFLLARMPDQAPWLKRTRPMAQPALWSLIGLLAMTVFGALHFLSALASPRLPGRWSEVAKWLASLEYAVWFMAYVLIVPYLGYLPSTILFALLMGLRAGYRSWPVMGVLVLFAIAVVVIFKAFLQVKVPGGAVYHYLPDGIRAVMLTYF